MMIHLEWPDGMPMAVGQMAVRTARSAFSACVKAWRKHGELNVAVDNEVMSIDREWFVDRSPTGKTTITISPAGELTMRHDATIRVALLDELIKTWKRKAEPPFANGMDECDNEATRIHEAEDAMRNKVLRECADDLEAVIGIYTD